MKILSGTPHSSRGKFTSSRTTLTKRLTQLMPRSMLLVGMCESRRETSQPGTGLYHEKQRLMQCGVHCLNCLYQEPWVDASRMDVIANAVAKEMGSSALFNPYRSFVPQYGNYDIAVMVRALESRGARLALHVLGNARLEEDLSELKAMVTEDVGPCVYVRGIVVNRRTRNPLRRLIDGRHWLALVVTDGLWFDVDSKLPEPVVIGGVDQLILHLRQTIMTEAGQAFVVVEGDKRVDKADVS